MAAGTIIEGVEVFGPPGCGLPLVGVSASEEPPGITSFVPPPEFGPALPAAPPFEPLQPHPAYPPSYPPAASAGPTETGPRMVKPYQLKTKDGGPAIIVPSTGDMLANEYATNGVWGVVDWAQRADIAAHVSWGGITDMPSHVGSYWWVGSGPPGTIPDANAGDLYLDSVTGNVYQFS